MQDVWLYARVSTTKDEQELSLEEQVRWGREYAAAADAQLTVFRERASAKSTIGRPVFQRMIADLSEMTSAKRPKQVAVTSLDRLSRDMTDTLLVSRTLRSLKVDLYVRDVGVVKAETFAQRAALVGQSMGGEAENEARSNRMRASWERRRREGKPTSNKVPYGLQLVDERDAAAEDSSAWVRRAFEWYANGVGTPTIALRMKNGAPPHVTRTNRLASDGLPIVRVRNPRWESNRVMKMLRQPRYRGTIVDPALYDRVQVLISSKPRWRQTRVNEYPLSGAVKCGGCGRSFHGGCSTSGPKKLASGETRGRRRTYLVRRYGCTFCNYTLNAERLEDDFRAQIGRLIGNERLLRRWVAGERPAGDARDIRREIAALERATAPDVVEGARAKAWALALDGPHASSDLERQLARIAAKLESDRARLVALGQSVELRDESKRTLDRAKRLLDGFWERYERSPYEMKRELMAVLTAALGGVTATKAGLRWARESHA